MFHDKLATIRLSYNVNSMNEILDKVYLKVLIEYVYRENTGRQKEKKNTERMKD